MQIQIPLSRQLVLIGGGHTHALLLRSWGMNPLPGVQVTVINPGATAPYTGMLPGYVAGHYDRGDLDIDLVRLARFAGARLIAGKASAIDRDNRRITVDDRQISYDVVSVDIGITSAMPEIPGFAEHGIPAKPLDRLAAGWDGWRSTQGKAEAAVIGGGVGGVELAMAMAHALRNGGRDTRITVLETEEVLRGIGEAARDRLLAAMADLGVEIEENVSVAEVHATHVTLADGRDIASHFTVGAAGARPHGWLSSTGLELHNGYITVDKHLQSSDPAIFAVGDCAHLSHAPRPKAGVFAVREAPTLFHNLRAVLSGGRLTSYSPQRDYLKLISLGGKAALAEKWGRAMSGPLLWRWKDRIDRKFMNQFTDLVPMQPDVPSVHAEGQDDPAKMMCGGCGAKVGRTALSGVIGDGDDAAVIVKGAAPMVMSTDHLRALTNDPAVMARIAAIHALGDIWAMGGTPGAATATVILPRMTAALQSIWIEEIMDAARDVFERAGGRIVGGHSSLGSELTIGFTVTGTCEREPIGLTGAVPGDALVLTKPIGSGVVMAAEMAMKAPGAVVLATLETMCMDHREASLALRDAHAMTDVTGFGLAGHLHGICQTSGVDAVVDLEAVPLLEGALTLSEAGVRSSLYPDNRQIVPEMRETARSALLFDPQTAGGLLAAIDGNDVDRVLAAIPGAVVIGRIVGGSGTVRLAE